MSVPYKDTIIEHQLQVRNVVQYCKDILNDGYLCGQMSFEPQQLFKFDGQVWRRFYDEPNTGNGWWRVQVS